MEQHTIFVLGAGFTKAFLPEAPLLVDNYDAEELAERYKAFPVAYKILRKEIDASPRGKIDLERLMTRLSVGMPYDSEIGAPQELAVVLSELKQKFRTKLGEARQGDFYKDDFAGFSRLCLSRRITCITFNYDDLLDQMLWELNRVYDVGQAPESGYWHPDGGYGFFCRPAEMVVSEGQGLRMDFTGMQLLKLHGSVNWRVRLGYPRPLSIDALVHYEAWLKLQRSSTDFEQRAIELQLERDPFIVPPVLAKESLVEEPVLRLVWSQAATSLSDAELVVFLGYSFPVTDIASRFLFSENIRPECRIYIVNYAQNKTQESDIRSNYRRVFPRLRHDAFVFSGGWDWCRKLTSRYSVGNAAT